MNNIKNGIYVTLDALLDTRYGMISKYDKKLLYGLIDNDKYFDRLYDEFGYMNNTIFNHLYSKKDKTVLMISPPTKIIELIASEFLLMESKLLEANEIPILPLTINTYPYTLTDKEMKAFTKAVKSWCLNDRIEVAFVNFNNESLTLKFINDYFSVAIMYSFSRWLDYQLNVKSGVAVSTTLYVPALLGTPIKVKKIKELENMFNSYSELFSPYIKLVHIPPESYCIQSQYKEKYLKQLKESTR